MLLFLSMFEHEGFPLKFFIGLAFISISKINYLFHSSVFHEMIFVPFDLADLPEPIIVVLDLLFSTIIVVFILFHFLHQVHISCIVEASPKFPHSTQFNSVIFFFRFD